MSHQSQIENTKYRSWVRGCLAFKYLKHGIENFAEDISKEEHTRILKTVSKSGDTCNTCEFKKLKPLHIKVPDPIQLGKYKCLYGQHNCNCLFDKKKSCPKSICDAILEDILSCHNSVPPSPNWKNTNIHDWCALPLEITKCFINSPGYVDKKSVTDIDPAGLLHVFINNINFQHHIATKIDGKDVFTKTRERRNDIFHSPAMELEDNYLNTCIDDIVAILEDEKELKGTQKSKEAVEKLKELRNQTFIITTHDEVEVCRHAMRSVNDRFEDLKNNIQDAKSDIDHKRKSAITAIEAKTTAVEQKLNEDRKEMSALHDRVNDLEQRLSTLEGQFKKMEDNQKTYKAHLDFVERKKDFQDNLVKLYKKHYINTWISTFETKDNTVSIQNVYVTPKIIEEVEDIDGKQVLITDYKDIFHSGDTTRKNIYITGDVGTGKSSFCKMMIYNWCQAVQDVDYEDRNAIEMKAFNFLFYIQLQRFQNFKSHDLTDMIKEQFRHETSTEVIENIFLTEGDRCIIIIDGLDEWIPPEQPYPLPHVTYGIPVGDGIKNAIFITLSRPSAKGILEMRTSEYDKIFILLGIEKDAFRVFTDKYMAILKQDKSKISEFKKEIRQSSLEHLMKTPLLLQQMICIFCKEGVIGKSVIEIYCNIINIALSWHKQKKRTNWPMINLKSETDFYNSVQLPIPLENFPRIIENKRLICLLGKTAFKNLVKNSFSNTFCRSMFYSFGLTENDLVSFVNVGFLVEHNAIYNVYDDTYLSFIHLSYLEFFAAVYISSNYHADQSILEYLFNRFRSANEVLELTNIISMICELSPTMLANISLSIANNTKVDESLIYYREQLHHNEEVNYRVPSNIQRFLYLCFSALSKENQGMIYLCDIIINNRTDIDFICKIDPTHVVSLSLGKSTYFIENKLQGKVFEWISKLQELHSLRFTVWSTPLPFKMYNILGNKVKFSHLSLIYYNPNRFWLDDCYISQSHHLQAVGQNLQVLSQVYSRLIETIIIFSPDVLIESHEVCTTLSTSFTNAVSLKHLTLKGVSCAICNTHIIDLSCNRNLSFLDLEYFTFIDLADCIETVILKRPRNLSHKECRQLTNTLTKSKSLKCLTLEQTKCTSSECSGHYIDLRTNKNLENLEIENNHAFSCSFGLGLIVKDFQKINVSGSQKLHDIHYSPIVLDNENLSISDAVSMTDISFKDIHYNKDDGNAENCCVIDVSELHKLEAFSPVQCLFTLQTKNLLENVRNISIDKTVCFSHKLKETLMTAITYCIALRTLTLNLLKCSSDECKGHELDLTQLSILQDIHMCASLTTIKLKTSQYCITQLVFINDGMFLTHFMCDDITTALGYCNSLKSMKLKNVQCNDHMCDGHSIELSRLNKIENIELTACSLSLVSQIKNESLESIEILKASSFTNKMCSDLAATLGNCVSLKSMSLDEIHCFQSKCDASVCESLKSMKLKKGQCNDRMCDGHAIELSRLNKIENIELTACSLSLVSQTKNESLESIKISKAASFTNKMFSDLVATLGNCVSLKSISLDGIQCFQSNCDASVIELSRLNQIETVEIIACSIIITSQSENDSIQKIRFVGANDVFVPHDMYDKLIAAIDHCVSVKEIALQNVKCSDASCKGHFIKLTAFGRIKNIEIIECPISVYTENTNESLERIKISARNGWQCAPGFCERLSTTLSMCTSLEHLELSNINYSSSNTRLHVVNLSKLHKIFLVDIKNSQFFIYSNENNTSLRNITLTYCDGTKLSHENCECFFNSLSRFISLYSIKISNIICDMQSCKGHDINLSMIAHTYTEFKNMPLLNVETKISYIVCKELFTVMLPKFGLSTKISVTFEFQGKTYTTETSTAADIQPKEFVSKLSNVFEQDESLCESVISNKFSRLYTLLNTQINLLEIKGKRNSRILDETVQEKEPYTNELNSVVNSLEHLKYLGINNCHIEQDVLFVTARMKTLELINMIGIVMSHSSLQTFMYSLSSLKHPVQVEFLKSYVMQGTNNDNTTKTNEIDKICICKLNECLEESCITKVTEVWLGVNILCNI